jgi:Fe2+ or Zn2+ uptake regulation protein
MMTRCTRQKDIILNVLRPAKKPLAVDAIFENAGGAKAIAISTVYRNISSFVCQGLVERLFTNGSVALYRLKKRDHQHYLICDSCKKMVPLPRCNLHVLEREVERATSFIVKSHHLQMVGTCKSCANEGLYKP